MVKIRGAIVGSVFPIKGSLSNDLKSRDNVHITTARERESYEIQGRSVLWVCAIRSYNYPQ